jgi:hypothetical protein
MSWEAFGRHQVGPVWETKGKLRGRIRFHFLRTAVVTGGLAVAMGMAENI